MSTDLPASLTLRFELKRLLARGAMGAVYLAWEKRLERSVAVKVLEVDDPEIVARFETEARVTAALSHPNIVEVFDFGVARSSPYVVYDYVEGTDVETLLEQRGRLPESWVRALGIAACAALEVAHEAQVVHRDLKPANLMVVRPADQAAEAPDPSMVRILDFGIARVRGALQSVHTRTGQVLGTPLYMAPEQILGDPIDARADLYGLGAVLFEVATGSPPFTGSSKEVLGGHLRGDLPDPRARAPELGPELAALLERCLARRPDQRPASAGELGRALEALPPVAAGGVPSPAPPGPSDGAALALSATAGDHADTGTLAAVRAQATERMDSEPPPAETLSSDEGPLVEGPTAPGASGFVLGNLQITAAVGAALGAGVFAVVLVVLVILAQGPEGPAVDQAVLEYLPAPRRLRATWRSGWEYPGLLALGPGSVALQASEPSRSHELAYELPDSVRGVTPVELGPPANPFHGEVRLPFHRPPFRVEGADPVLRIGSLPDGVLRVRFAGGVQEFAMPSAGVVRIQPHWMVEGAVLEEVYTQVALVRQRKDGEPETLLVPYRVPLEADLARLLHDSLVEPLRALDARAFARAAVEYCEVELGLVDPTYNGAQLRWDDRALEQLVDLLEATKRHFAGAVQAPAYDAPARRELLEILFDLRLLTSMVLYHGDRFRSAGGPWPSRVSLFQALDLALRDLEEGSLRPAHARTRGLPPARGRQVLLEPPPQRSLWGLSNSRWENENWRKGAFADRPADPMFDQSEYVRIATSRANEVLVARALREARGGGDLEGEEIREAVREVLRARALGEPATGAPADVKAARAAVEDGLLGVVNPDRAAPALEVPFTLEGEEPAEGYQLSVILSGIRPQLVVRADLDGAAPFALVAPDIDASRKLGHVLEDAKKAAAAGSAQLLPEFPKGGLHELSLRIPPGLLPAGEHTLRLRLLHLETPYDISRRMGEFFRQEESAFELLLPRLHQVALVE